MNKIVYFAGLMAMFAFPVFADTVIARVIYVEPNYANAVQVQETRCEVIQVPVYGTVYRQGNPGAGALIGGIIGGLVGQNATGNDEGAVAGAVIGSVIGATNNQVRNETVITGYRNEQQCAQVIVNQVQPQAISYRVVYEWNDIRGEVVTYNFYRAGDTIPITVNIIQ